MALTKRTYVSRETAITAQNLNEIQDSIIDLENVQIPTSLKNPYSIKITQGAAITTYDGSEEKQSLYP